VNEQQSWKENKRARRTSVLEKMATCLDGYKRGLEQGVDSNKNWTRTRIGHDQKR